MRIKITRTDIVEVTKVIVTPSGIPDKNSFGKYKDIRCYLEMIWGDKKYERIHGEFDCKGVDNLEDCEKVSYKFVDELYKDGCIDISTDEKCAEYGLTIY